MRRDTADDQPSIGRVLAAGSARILRQSRLSRGQAVALVLSLLAAVAVGVMVQPRERASAPPRVAEAPAAAPEADAASPSGTGPVVRALDGLAGQIAAINDRLGDEVARERAARERSAARPAATQDGESARAPEPAAPAAAPAAAPEAPIAAPRIAVPFAPAAMPIPRARRAPPARPRQSSLRRDAEPRLTFIERRRIGGARFTRPIRAVRHARRPRRERHRGLFALRDVFLRGLRLPF